jgi:hypothetical protein
MFCVMLMELLSSAEGPLPSYDHLATSLTSKLVLEKRGQLVELAHKLAREGGSGVRHAAGTP